MKRLFPLLIALFIGAVVLSSSVFIVRERDYALVFALGEVKKIVSEPGLYFKLPPPFQNVVTLDKRLPTVVLRDLWWERTCGTRAFAGPDQRCAQCLGQHPYG